MTKKNRNYWIGIYALSILIFLLLHYLLELNIFFDFAIFNSSLKNITLTLATVSFIFLIRSILEKLIDKLDQSQGDKYNLKRITRLVTNILVIFFVITSLFQNPYKSLAGLGIASLVLGFALQAPITSFIGWLYVIFRGPYKVGDRIQVSEHRGDVIEISYLETIIQECNGAYLGNDRKSGRTIHFPNSKILTDRVINYSGTQIPFIWNETAIQIAYTSDLKFVEKCLITAALDDFKRKYPSRASMNLQRWTPAVYYRTNKYAWMEAIVQYPVEPYDTTRRRNHILQTALPALNAAPEKVQFPEGTQR